MSEKRREHPFGTSLALFASGDLSWRDHLTVGMHVFGCRQCRHVIEQCRSIRSGVESHQAAMPADVDWESLAGEIKANIHLGLDAGAIVNIAPLEPDPEPEPEPYTAVPDAAGWRAAVVLASVLMVVASGWYLNRIQHVVPSVSSQAPLSAQVKAEGLEVAERGSALTLLTPIKTSVRTGADWGGSLRARYVDSETDQVTVSQVYTDAK